PFRYRHEIAKKVLEKAGRFGAGLGDLDDFMQKQAGAGASATHEVASLLFDRARLLKLAGKVDYAVEMGKMARAVAADPAAIHDNARLVKRACLVDDTDRVTGLSRQLDDLTQPEDVFFTITQKTASKLREEHFTTTSGNIYKLTDLDVLKLADVRDMMGDDF